MSKEGKYQYFTIGTPMICYGCDHDATPTKYKESESPYSDAYHTYTLVDEASKDEVALQFSVYRKHEYCDNFLPVGKVGSIYECAYKIRQQKLEYFTIGSPLTCYSCASKPEGFISNTDKETDAYYTYILEDADAPTFQKDWRWIKMDKTSQKFFI